MDGSNLFPPMNANEWLVDRWKRDLRFSVSELADCRRKGLRSMAGFWQRQAVYTYLNLRSMRGRAS